MQATAIQAITILSIEHIEGDTILLTTCPDYDAFRALPQAVDFDGTTYGLTGWNSDRCIACYKDTALVAVSR